MRKEDIRIIEEGDKDEDGLKEKVRIEEVEMVGEERYINEEIREGKKMILRVEGR